MLLGVYTFAHVHAYHTLKHKSVVSHPHIITYRQPFHDTVQICKSKQARLQRTIVYRYDYIIPANRVCQVCNHPPLTIELTSFKGQASPDCERLSNIIYKTIPLL